MAIIKRIIENGAALTNRIIPFPFTQGTAVQSNAYAADTVSPAYVSFYIPDDFVALVKLFVRFVPNATGSVTLNRTGEYANVGELENTHLEFGSSSFNFTPHTGKITEFDVSGVFSSLSAGDQCGLEFNNQSAPFAKMMLVLEYSR